LLGNYWYNRIIFSIRQISRLTMLMPPVVLLGN
jgi:hypothetical protein